MKKTVTANIAGTVFHIEEDAFEQLQRYLAGIRANFSGSPGADEIMADIESRIAELFGERLTGRSVVTIDDVRHVETVMGRPEDFAGEHGNAGQSGSDAPGAGPAASSWNSGKRFMRDPDDKWLGGVLGGLGAYIGVEALWLRIAVIALVLMSVGSLIPIYILLWILVPKAETAADRLRMRGEPLTVENIKRMADEGADRFKQGGEQFAREAENLGRTWGPKAQAWGHEAGQQFRQAGGHAGQVARKLVGAGLIVIGFIALLSLITGLVGGSVSLWHLGTVNDGSMGLLDLGGLIFNSREHALWCAVGLFALVAVPVIGIFLAGFRLLLNTRAPKWLGWGLAVVWFAALFPTIISITATVNEFRRENSTRDEVPLQQPATGLLYLDALAAREGEGDWSVQYHHGDLDMDLDGISVEDGMVNGAWADLDVRTSPDTLFHLVLERSAHGRTTKAALARAQAIATSTRQDGDVLYVSPVLRFPTSDKVRAQDVHFVLEVPVGRSVFFRPGAKHIIYDVDNVTNTLDRDMLGRQWTMTTKGLEDLGGRPYTPPSAAPVDSTGRSTVATAVWHGPRKRTVTRSTRQAAAPAAQRVELPNLFGALARLVRV